MISLTIQLGEARGGLWCPWCNLPSLSRVPILWLTDDGVSTLGWLWMCDDGPHPWDEAFDWETGAAW